MADIVIPVSVAGPETGSSGVCGLWVTPDDVSGPCADYDGVVLEAALQVASDVLFALSGRRFPGECSEVLRPRGGYLVDRRCISPREYVLPSGPVRDVLEVLIDGDALPAESYTVQDGTFLVRTDGDAWPTYQDLTRPTTDDHTWSIEYTYGHLPPEGGKRAAISLACELAALWDPGADSANCRLSPKVTAASSQGITVQVLNPSDFLSNGLTGLMDVDLWLKSVNPEGLQREARVLTPQSYKREGRRV